MYKIKEMPFDERPRERLRKVGASQLSTVELIAILLRTGNRNKNVIELSHQVMKEIEQIDTLQYQTIEEMKKIEGIGETKAITLLAAIELGKRVYFPKERDVLLQTSKDVYEYLAQDYQNLEQEVLTVLYLDAKSKLIAKKELFVGTLNQSLIHPREVFKYAVKYSSYAIVLVHNHPSGDATPSRQDINMTRMMIKNGEMMQIKVIDHIIMGINDYESVMEYL